MFILGVLSYVAVLCVYVAVLFRLTWLFDFILGVLIDNDNNNIIIDSNNNNNNSNDNNDI